jgi:hypothetical protein
MTRTLTLLSLAFLFGTAFLQSASAGRFSNCIKCHNPAKVFKSNQAAIKALIRESGSNAARAASDIQDSGLRVFLDAVPQDILAEKPSLYAVVPDNEATYRAVYELDETVAVDDGELERLEADKVMLALTYRQKSHFAEGDGAADLLRFIKENRDKNLIILGHNEDGKFRLPNGDSVPLSEVEHACKVEVKNCVFVSCNSQEWVSSALSVRPGISYDEATEIALNLDAVIRGLGGNDADPEVLATRLDSIVLEARWSTGKEVIKAGSLPGLVIISLGTGAYVESGED